MITRRDRRLDPRHATTFRGIPVTTVPRTLVDLAGVLSNPTLHARVTRPRFCSGSRRRWSKPCSATCPNAAGAGLLRVVLLGGVPVSLSKIESVFFNGLREEGLPLPETTAGRRRRVDCRWPDYRLTVEIDGYRYHHSRHAWEQDRRREREARARGDEFRRYTYGDVMEDRRYMFAELRQLLSTLPDLGQQRECRDIGVSRVTRAPAPAVVRIALRFQEPAGSSGWVPAALSHARTTISCSPGSGRARSATAATPTGRGPRAARPASSSRRRPARRRRARPACAPPANA